MTAYEANDLVQMNKTLTMLNSELIHIVKDLERKYKILTNIAAKLEIERDNLNYCIKQKELIKGTFEGECYF